MSYIYLIRHGETQWNLEERFQGTTNTELTDRGMEQGMLLAKGLEGTAFRNLYSSPLDRARITAGFIGERTGTLVEPDEDFREISFGDWEGLTTKEIRDRYDWMDRWFLDAGEYQIPGGCNMNEEKDRLRARLVRIAEAAEGQNTAIVSHAGVIRLSILGALDLPLSYYWRFVFGNTSVSILEYYKGIFLLKGLNDTSHLLNR